MITNNLDNYINAMDGSYGCKTRYDESIIGKSQHQFTEDDWAYLSGHYSMLADLAIERLDKTK